MSVTTGKSEAFPYPTSAGRWECHLPSDGTLYDYVYEYKQRGQWRQWAETVRNIPIPDAKSLKELTIPTVDTARSVFFKIYLYQINYLKICPFLTCEGTRIYWI